MSTQPAAKAFAALHLNATKLLVPLHELHSLEAAVEIDAARGQRGSVGAIQRGDTWMNVLCLSDDLELTAVLAPDFRICAIVNNDEFALTLACQAVHSIQATALDFSPLPPSMRSPYSPIHALARDNDNNVYCCTSVAQLASLLESQR